MRKPVEQPTHQEINPSDKDQPTRNLQVPRHPKDLDVFPENEKRSGCGHGSAAANLARSALVFGAEMAFRIFVVAALRVVPNTTRISHPIAGFNRRLFLRWRRLGFFGRVC